MMISKKVAVVGGGPAGLVAARELRREDHVVVVFERGTRLGGTWVYTPETDSDPLGLDPFRTVVHSSLYKSLRINMPRELMGYRDFPFLVSDLPDRDSRRYPTHEEVLKYLEDFAGEFRLEELIRYQTEVLFVGLEEDGKWKVKSKKNNNNNININNNSSSSSSSSNSSSNNSNNKELDNETYDAVVICNGHYTEPKIANIPGIEVWPGWQCHSHNYRTPKPYQNRIVVLIGGSTSANDICKDIAGAAKEVHVACRSDPGTRFMKTLVFDNVFLHSMIDRVHEDGRVAFQDDSDDVIADVILHCTGYKFHYPFLHTDGVMTVDDNRVGPLYKHVFPPALAPGISFIGIPSHVAPFIHFELQSKWVAGVLSGRIPLPSKEQMMQDVKDLYSKLEATNVPKPHTHRLNDFEFEIEDWMAKQCGCAPIEKWRKEMFYAEYICFITRTNTFRDELNYEYIT